MNEWVRLGEFVGSKQAGDLAPHKLEKKKRNPSRPPLGMVLYIRHWFALCNGTSTVVSVGQPMTASANAKHRRDLVALLPCSDLPICVVIKVLAGDATPNWGEYGAEWGKLGGEKPRG